MLRGSKDAISEQLGELFDVLLAGLFGEPLHGRQARQEQKGEPRGVLFFEPHGESFFELRHLPRQSPHRHHPCLRHRRFQPRLPTSRDSNTPSFCTNAVGSKTQSSALHEEIALSASFHMSIPTTARLSMSAGNSACTSVDLSAPVSNECADDSVPTPYPTVIFVLLAFVGSLSK